ncbi:cell shape-determining protein MreC [Caldalkalibacillus thermarum]|uniref:rod shape-determining protein MreC n=1 Tax=Caldalkalibacillus thermarum TaxID=296745 RepID=UPI0016691C83|nr:rod shape-determining protein MreC [Caldalkalibacillus thermarum]GGK15958.1 cell shape-determining protein MreC [Caldalkalibacillus thermarum]
MPSFFSNRRLIVLLVSTIVMVVVVGITLKERPQPTWGEQFIRDTFGFFQSIAYKPARQVAGFFETINEWRTLYSENQRLKANLQENAKLMARIRELELENESLKRMLDVKSNLRDYQLIAAEVISRSPDRWYQQVTINRGAKHGVKANMAVITTEGLIGRVKSVSQFTSQVELLSDVNRVSHISAIVQGNENIFGVIEGYDLERGALLFQKIPKDAPLEEGQTVVTSGLGGIYPRGLYIGQIVEVVPDQYDLTQSALVEPAANLYHLDYVFVVEQSSLPPVEIPGPDEDKEGTEG